MLVQADEFSCGSVVESQPHLDLPIPLTCADKENCDAVFGNWLFLFPVRHYLAASSIST